MEIIKLDFKKTTNTIDSSDYGHVDLEDTHNLTQIEKYIIPIIAENEGWGTPEVSLEGFKQNPSQFQDAFDASLFANVHVALDENNKPAGLIEYLVETIESPVSKARMANIVNMFTDKQAWAELLELRVLEASMLEENFADLKNFITGKNIYTEVGVVVRPDLQGKKTGIAQSLYEILHNGIIFAWTSNPVVLAQWRKYFTEVIAYPLFGEKIDTLHKLATIAILYADLLTYERKRWEIYEFGALNSPYFVSNRDDYYLELAEELQTAGKIKAEDEQRIKYCIEKTAVQGALFAFN